jgi:hypothetical protein
MPIIDWPRTLREVDGKRVLQTNDDIISLENAACGYKGLRSSRGIQAVGVALPPMIRTVEEGS